MDLSSEDCLFKCIDTQVDDAVIAATGFVVSPSRVPLGVASSERIGRRIRLSKILWRFRIELPSAASATDTADVTRLLVVLDNSANGAYPGLDDILATANFQAFPNKFNELRFTVLWDRTITINESHDVNQGITQYCGYMEMDLPGIVVDYSGDSASIVNVTGNNLLCVAVTELGLTGLQSICRVEYTDS